MGEHAISGDDPVPHRQDPEQFQRRLVLVGLGVDPQLRRDGTHIRRIGREQVNPGRLTVTTAPRGLAVEGQMLRRLRSQPGLNPAADAGLEVGDIDPAEDAGIGGLAEAPPPGESQQAQEVSAPLLAVIDDGLVAGHAREHGDDGQGQERREGMSLAPRPSRIVNSLKEFHQGERGIHSRVLMKVASLRINDQPCS